MQIIGSAYEVNNDDLIRVHNLYQEKFGQKDYDLEEMKNNNPDGRAYWVFKPTVISLWDEVNFPDNPKQIFELHQNDWTYSVKVIDRHSTVKMFELILRFILLVSIVVINTDQMKILMNYLDNSFPIVMI